MATGCCDHRRSKSGRWPEGRRGSPRPWDLADRRARGRGVATRPRSNVAVRRRQGWRRGSCTPPVPRVRLWREAESPFPQGRPRDTIPIAVGPAVQVNPVIRRARSRGREPVLFWARRKKAYSFASGTGAGRPALSCREGGLWRRENGRHGGIGNLSSVPTSSNGCSIAGSRS